MCKKEVLNMKNFKYAFRGIGMAFTQRNFIIEFCVGLIVALSMLFFDYTSLEKSILFLMIFLVLSAEIFNTAIEKVIDLVSPERNELAGGAKDLAAGAVLLLSICSLIIAVLIILPKIISAFSF